jgi:hypothetical protein
VTGVNAWYPGSFGEWLFHLFGTPHLKSTKTQSRHPDPQKKETLKGIYLVNGENTWDLRIVE